ncbi:MAG TPA: LysM peptidoglycan-binding domain-containing M23 family metallopeptidase [Myxococcaceae bacterium]|nr:LysM peptidoglycan-binding domain-containing M23 family metallopeptidase [Myxococcaceae bacterium]
MRAASLRVVGVVCALLVSAGCTGSRSARVMDDAPASTGEAFGQPHPEPELELEERIARAVAKRGEGMRSHRVRAGETIYRIAVNNGVTPDALMQANGITDPTSLSVGTVLRIPDGGVVSAKTAASPTPRRTGRPVSLRDRPDSPTLGQLEWPLRGVLYARFGRKGTEPHDGIDLAAPLGTTVRTAGPGVVLFAGEQPSYGRIVIIEHANGLITLYAYNHELRVASGDVVKPQQEISTVGQAGESSGPHLHFEVRREGLPVDPLLYLGPVPPPPPAETPAEPTG